MEPMQDKCRDGRGLRRHGAGEGLVGLQIKAQARDKIGCSLAAETLRAWGVLKLRATGVSMLPTLWPGDLLTIQSRRPEQVQPGDIVLFMRRRRLFIHRLVSKSLTAKGAVLITRGDCMYKHDPPVRGGELLGRITEVRRGGSIFLPGRKLSRFHRMLAFTLCHWSLFRRAALRLWMRRHKGDCQPVSPLVEAAPYRTDTQPDHEPQVRVC